MSNIYKVITLDKDNIKNIFIFNGYDYKSKEKINNTDSEQNFIDENLGQNAKVKLIKDVFIYDDDTIYELKRKIIENCFNSKYAWKNYIYGRKKLLHPMMHI